VLEAGAAVPIPLGLPMRPWILAAVAPFAVATLDGRHLARLPPAPGPRGARTSVEAAIEKQRVCIGSAVFSAGTLSNVLYYRSRVLADGKIAVGYFAFFSEERPWGNNWLTWSLVPALAVDLVYSRALFVGPGLQRFVYGAGDVEGVGIVYQRDAGGSLHVDHALVDGDDEQVVTFSRDQVFALDPGSPVFYADAWSHQLGARSARSRADLAYLRCYADDSIRPLPDAVARAFRVDEGRAPPAHLEKLEGSQPSGEVALAPPLHRLTH